MRFYSPLRYPGGKSGIFNFVSKLFYENNLIGTAYAEPYAGGSGLALRLLSEGYVSKIFLNDLDMAIYSFWVTVLNDADRFCAWIESVDVTVDNWLKFKDVRSNSDTVSHFEMAQSTFYLNRTNVSGVLTGGIIGGAKQRGKYKIDARFNKPDLIKRIQAIAQLKDRIVVTNSDGISFVNRMNKKNESVFVYLDPPYYGKGSQLYLNSYADKDHSRLSKYVDKLDIPWMVSYDNQQFIMNLYSKYRRAVYQFSQCASNRVGDEVLIFSDELAFDSSLSELNAPNLISPVVL